MRFIEVALLVIGIILPFLILNKKVQESKRLCFVFLIGIFLSHVVLEGIRWQMSSIYLIYVSDIIFLAKGYSFFSGHWLKRITWILFSFFLLGLGYLLSTTFPVFDLPNPSGKYIVGSQYIHLVTKEDEIITQQLDDKRELMIKVWYPSKLRNENKEAYLNQGEREGFTTKYGLPSFLLKYLDNVKTNTYSKPKIAEGTFPVLIFSHGYQSNASGYYALLEEVVSRGFIVLNINHTYESVGSLFPSDEIRFYSSQYNDKNNNEEMGEMVWYATQAFKEVSTLDEKNKAINEAIKKYYAAEITHRWTRDIKSIIEEIPVWNKNSFLENHIDVTKIGAFGHSQGGAAIGQALLDIPEIMAGINMDGIQWGTIIDTFYSKPFLHLSSDWPEDHPDFNKVIYHRRSTADFYEATIINSGHSNFQDIPYMINATLINEAGSINHDRAIQISSQLIVQFFNKYLKYDDINLLKEAEHYEELQMELHPRRK